MVTFRKEKCNWNKGRPEYKNKNAWRQWCLAVLSVFMALSTLRWYSLKNELQQCVKSCLRTAFLVAFDKDLLEQNPFSK
uniref:hypothetical protein n=1 Tax=Lactococcus muris TaxID=2941330 RepID=UPI00373FD409